MAKDVTQIINFTKRGAALGAFFQIRPDIWLKRLRNVCIFQLITGVIALFVWIITWLKGMDKLLPDYDGPLSDVEKHQISKDHQNLYGAHVALVTISAIVGAIGGMSHHVTAYSKGVGWGLFGIDALLVLGYSLAYYFSITFYTEHLDAFDTAVVGGLIASCLAGFFTLIAGLVELACAIVPSPIPKIPAPADPFNRTIDPERIPFLILELQDAFNYVLFNRTNLNNMNIPFQSGFQPHPPPFPVGSRNNANIPTVTRPVYPYPAPAPAI